MQMAQQNFSNRNCLNEFLGLTDDRQVQAWLRTILASRQAEFLEQELAKLNKQVLLNFVETLPIETQVPYARCILWKNHEMEVMLARWNKQMACSPHNHGFSNGFVWFVQGDFEEVGYVFEQGQLRSQSKKIWSAGEVSRVQVEDIHSCRPHDGGVTLHFYSPPIHQMKVYSYEQKATYLVSDTCGAWEPLENSDLISVSSWDKIS